MYNKHPYQLTVLCPLTKAKATTSFENHYTFEPTDIFLNFQSCFKDHVLCSYLDQRL